MSCNEKISDVLYFCLFLNKILLSFSRRRDVPYARLSADGAMVHQIDP